MQCLVLELLFLFTPEIYQVRENDGLINLTVCLVNSSLGEFTLTLNLTVATDVAATAEGMIVTIS